MTRTHTHTHIHADRITENITAHAALVFTCHHAASRRHEKQAQTEE